MAAVYRNNRTFSTYLFASTCFEPHLTVDYSKTGNCYSLNF